MFQNSGVSTSDTPTPLGVADWSGHINRASPGTGGKETSEMFLSTSRERADQRRPVRLT